MKQHHAHLRRNRLQERDGLFANGNQKDEVKDGKEERAKNRWPQYRQHQRLQHEDRRRMPENRDSACFTQSPSYASQRNAKQTGPPAPGFYRHEFRRSLPDQPGHNRRNEDRVIIGADVPPDIRHLHYIAVQQCQDRQCACSKRDQVCLPADRHGKAASGGMPTSCPRPAKREVQL